MIEGSLRGHHLDLRKKFLMKIKYFFEYFFILNKLLDLFLHDLMVSFSIFDTAFVENESIILHFN